MSIKNLIFDQVLRYVMILTTMSSYRLL